MLDLKELAKDALEEEKQYRNKKIKYLIILVLIFGTLYFLMSYREQTLDCSIDNNTCRVTRITYLGNKTTYQITPPDKIKSVYYEMNTSSGHKIPDYDVCFRDTESRYNCFFKDILSRKRAAKSVNSINKLLNSKTKEIHYKL